MLSPLIMFLYGGYFLDTTVGLKQTAAQNLTLPAFSKAMLPIAYDTDGKRLDVWTYYSPEQFNPVFAAITKYCLESYVALSRCLVDSSEQRSDKTNRVFEWGEAQQHFDQHFALLGLNDLAKVRISLSSSEQIGTFLIQTIHDAVSSDTRFHSLTSFFDAITGSGIATISVKLADGTTQDLDTEKRFFGSWKPEGPKGYSP